MADNALKEIEGLDDLPKPIDVEIDKGKDELGKDAGKERQAAADAGKDAAPKEDENVVSLRRSLAAERRQREAAEARVAEEKTRREALEARSAEGQLRLTTNSLEAAQTAKTRAIADYRAAMEKSDHTAAAEAQAAITDAQYQISSLTRGKEEMEARLAQEQQAREQQAQRRPAPQDPVEALASGMSTKSATWLREHPECATDQQKFRKMIRAHEDAGDEGIEADTPEYFAFIEKRLGFGHDDGGDGQRADPPQRQTTQRRPTTDAPVARSGAGDGRSAVGQKVTLTPSQRQFCDESGLKYEDYARQLVALKNEGRLQ